MTTSTYTFTCSVPDSDVFLSYIQTTLPNAFKVKVSGPYVDITFNDILSESDYTTLVTIVQNYVYEPPTTNTLDLSQNYLSIPTVQEPPTPSVTGVCALYIDVDDNFLKAKDHTGRIYIVNPILTKGSLLGYSASTGTNSPTPTGANTQYLSYSTSADTGLQWKSFVFGTGCLYTQKTNSVSLTTPNVSSYTNYLTLNTGFLTSGTYRVCSVCTSTLTPSLLPPTSIDIQMTVNNTVVDSITYSEYNGLTTSTQRNTVLLTYMTLSGSNSTLKLNFRLTTASLDATATLNTGKLEIWRLT